MNKARKMGSKKSEKERTKGQGQRMNGGERFENGPQMVKEKERKTERKAMQK